MKSQPVRLALLSLPLALGLAACQPSGDGTAQPDTTSAEISGAGASFVFPLMSRWSADYNAATGHRVNYQSIGSGGGIAQVKAATVDFGSSGAPLSSGELAAAGLGEFPSPLGGGVPVFRLAGFAPGELRLAGAVLADIFLGDVSTWNDPAIAGLNPGLDLPATEI